MMRSILTGSLLISAAACSGSSAEELPKLAAAEDASGIRSLAAGSRVDAILQSGISSRIDKAGKMLRATVTSDSKDSFGTVVIPKGSVVKLTITQLDPGNDQILPDGRISLAASSVSIDGISYSLSSNMQPVPHELKGRGITTDEAARIGAGTAIGAVAGNLIGKSTKGTVIGGAVGAVAGTAVAVHYAYRDVVVSAGTPIVFTLARTMNVSVR